MVNDTHDHKTTIERLANRINTINPDAVVWNGDATNTFDTPQQTARICLTPGQKPSNPSAGGWASTRPLLFTLGNHDARGKSARTLPEVITPWPLNTGDPLGLSTTPAATGRYCFVKRIGPLAIVCLDTGEDKPDSRAVWGGMAAYEPYRKAQREWLLKALKQPEIASAPYLITFCHIPLRGLKGENDGTGPTGYCDYSGFGQKLWLQPLIDAGCQMILSGHTHQYRIDPPNKEFPIYQVVGGGPKESNATITHIQADAQSLRLNIESLKKETLGEVTLTPRKIIPIK
jgi:predicted phosphodiesterase